MKHDPDYVAMLERMVHGSPTVSYTCRNEPGWPTDFVSQNAQELLGRCPSEFVDHQTLRDFVVHEEDRIRVAEESEIAFSDPSVLEFENAPYRVMHSNGSWVWITGRTILNRDEKGEILSITGFLTDVSALLSLQQSLLEASLEKEERIKEKECLSAIRDAIDRHDLLHDTLDEVVALIPLGWAFPGLTQAKVLFDDVVHETTSEPPGEWLIEGDLRVAGVKRGALQVWYSIRPELPTWVDFMPEEYHLFEELLRVISLGIERKEATRALKDHKIVVSSAKDMLAVITRGGKIRLANTAFKNTFGLLHDDETKTEALPVLLRSGMPEDVIELFRSALNGVSSRWQGTIRGKNGADMILSTDLAPFITAEEGVEGVLVAIRDITEEKSKESHLVRLTRAIEQASESIIITDAESRIEYVNPFFEKITGYSLDEVKGQNPRILKSGNIPASFYRAMWAQLASGKAWEGRFVNRTKDGRLITEDATISPVTDEAGAVTNFIAVKRDITREVALSSRLESFLLLKADSRKVRRAQHELTNDMAIIIGHAELLMDKTTSIPTATSSLSTIVEMAQRTNSLLEQSIAGSAEGSDEVQETDLAATLNATASAFRRMIPESILFEFSESNTSFKIPLPASDLDHIVTHILLNAVDAIDDSGQISISTALATWVPSNLLKRGAKAEDFVLLSISDDGCGMSDLVLSRVFDDTFTTKPEEYSTGMGLPSARRLIERVDGHIEIESAQGKGTTIRIWLPLCNQEEIIRDSDRMADSEAHGRRILVVDDDPALLEMTQFMLELEGFDVVTSSSGADAINKFSHADPPFDLLVSDVVMDPMDGIELAEQWRAVFPDRQVILMSGYANPVDLDTRYSSEGVALLQKPFETDTLLSFVFQALDGTKPRPLA